VSQFFVLSARGDSIVYRDFRSGDVKKNTVTEVFFRSVKFWNGKQNNEAPPVFRLDKVNYLWTRKNGLFFVFTARHNTSPAFVMELLIRMTRVFKDYCGTLSEESLRTNFVLIYELLDEIVDNGYVQDTSTELLKAYVFNTPVAVATPATGKKPRFRVPSMSSKTAPSTSVDNPIDTLNKNGKQKKRKNEIFVDIYERVSVTFNSNGYILNRAIDGTIQMKSYLAGNPDLRLALNEDLLVGQPSTGSNAVQVDNCNFHECARLDEFESQRLITFTPPDGEFTVMNYRVTSEFRAPFRIFPFFELINAFKVELVLKIRAEIPDRNYGSNVVVSFPVPKSCTNVNFEMGQGVIGQETEFESKANRVFWRIKKLQGATETTLRCRLILSDSAAPTVRKEISPISLNFEIPMYNPSGLSVKYLRTAQKTNYSHYRWVRYVARSNSYVCRI
jgi:AP-4 complex subunit mu-1